MGTESLTKQGRLEAASLPRLVRDLWRAEATGSLHLWNRDTNKRIVFKKGDVVFAATNVDEERLGERLVQAGKIKRSVLDLSFRVMERSNERFGKTVVELGWISPMEMQRFVATQIKDIIYSVFTWDEGDYRFEPEDEPVPPDLALELHTAEIIYEGACRISDYTAIRAGVGSWKNVLKLASGKRLAIPITQEDGYVLSRIRRGTTIGDVVATSSQSEEETLRRIYALLLAGVLAVEEPEPDTPAGPCAEPEESSQATDEERRFRDALAARHAALQFGNYYDRLGVDFGASGKKIRKSYEEVMASLEPAAAFRDRVADIDERVSRVKRKVREAYEVLSVAETRYRYDLTVTGTSPDKTLSADGVANHTPDATTVTPRSAETFVAGPLGLREQAELFFLEAKRLYNGGDYFDAVSSLNEALARASDNGSYHRLLAQWLSQNPGCWETALEHFERAIDLDRRDVEAHLGLASLHEETSRRDKASELYQKVLELDPDNRIARERLVPQIADSRLR